MKFLIGYMIFLSSLNILAGTIITHKRTSNFLDIEIDKSNFFINCADYPKDKISYLSFYVADGESYYFFYCRRPRGLKQCHEEKAEYTKMTEQGATVRLVGIAPKEEKNPKIYSDTPKQFHQAKKMTSATFIRLQVKDKCKAYFEDDCELPKNYWAATMPE